MSHTMKVRLTLKPGQKGTKSLAEEYGDRLFRVRYRYDEKTGKRFKTAELIIEETIWHSSRAVIHDDTLVGITVGYQEKDLQNSVRRGGGVWDKEQKLRFLKYGKVVELGLAERIVQTDKVISI